MSIAHTVRLMVGAVAALAIVGAVVFLTRSDAVGSALVLEIQSVQRDLHRQLASAMHSVQAHGLQAGYALVGLSFLYGVFHAAGPGHGKVVISTYLLTQESQLRRGLLLSLVASLCQGLTAVVVVALVAGVLDLTLRQAQGTAAGLETLSYALVALLGMALMASRARQLLRRSGRTGALPGSEHDDHHHASGHHAGGHHEHEHHGHGADCASCGHAHGPTAKDLEAPLSWHGLAGMIASIGVRPCSGAILVLLVAFSLDLRLAGILAVMAMSLGTAITVSGLAVLSVYARKGALRVASLIPNSTGRLSVAVDLVAVVGGGVILLAGVLMLQADLSTPAHPLR